MRDDQARFWMVAGTSGGNGSRLIETMVLLRGIARILLAPLATRGPC